ncbi:GNAT family N-acetyltransferase [Nocardia sp. NBC_01499]|uniref:GNAT family N-acetyltransferase n=1 Tax=Nocardia sp. NBC_01499 TaxID=2903597 RepID=UPI00386C7FD1
MADLTVGGLSVVVRDLVPEDEAAVLEVFAASEDWFVAETGQPSAPGDVQSLYYVLPEGSDLDDKVLLVIEVDGRVVGMIDAVQRYPHPQAISLGLFVIRPEFRRRGLGRAVVDALLGEARSRGFETIRTHTAVGWHSGREFLRAMGFAFDEPGMFGTEVNRNPGPDDRPIIPAARTI